MFYITTKWHRIVFRCELGSGTFKTAVNYVDQSKTKKVEDWLSIH